MSWGHGVTAKDPPLRLPDDLVLDAQAMAGVEGESVNETAKTGLEGAIERQGDQQFIAGPRRIIEEDQELPERLTR